MELTFWHNTTQNTSKQKRNKKKKIKQKINVDKENFFVVFHYFTFYPMIRLILHKHFIKAMYNVIFSYINICITEYLPVLYVHPKILQKIIKVKGQSEMISKRYDNYIFIMK